MYPAVLFLHSWVRWAVLLLGAIVVARAFAGSARGQWTTTDSRLARAFGITLDIQFLLGLALYLWLSPVTSAGLHDLAAVMRVAQMRFWIVEHPVGTLAAIILAHIGSARIRKAADDAKRRRLARIFYSLALLLVLGSIPWPGMPYGRTLMRSF